MQQPKFPCFYPIFSLPPNIYHFNTAQILSHRDGVSSVIIIIPNIPNDYLNQDQAVKLFELYGAGSTMMDFRVEKATSHNAFQDIIDRFKKDGNLTAFVAVDEKTARSKRFNDIFHIYNNMEPQIIPSNFEEASKEMTEAIETGKKSLFLKNVPQGLTPQQKDECWNVVHSEINEQIITKEYWKNLITEYIVGESEEDAGIFDTSTTGMPNYDSMIESPAYYYFFKDRDISLEWMTPKEYMEKCAKYVHDTSTEDEYDNVNKTDVAAIEKIADSGKKLDTPVLNIADKSQEGRHRSVVAADKGMKKMPVYVISPVDLSKKDEAKGIINKSKSFEEAERELKKVKVPMDKMTYKKMKWKEFKQKTDV